MGSSSQDFAGVLSLIFKTKSSVTGSKVCDASPVKEASEETVGYGGGEIVSDGADLLRKVFRKDSREIIRVKS